MMDWLQVIPNDTPLIVSIPHAGRDIPVDYREGLISLERAVQDADIFVDRLYAFAQDLGATVVKTSISRTVIDVNRDPSGASLYPGLATTGLCPLTTFDGEPLYQGHEPDVEARRLAYFDPYHAALQAEITRLRGLHPAIVLYDAHSIRSRVARLFDGELPQFNIGSNDGASCAPILAAQVQGICQETGLGTVINGRFKGGWITRHYGAPNEGVHAIQMELAQRGYMNEETGEWDEDRASRLQETLAKILRYCIDFAKGMA